MHFKHLHLIPIILFVLFFCTIITSYVMSAIVRKDIEMIFPYISDTGTFRPTSSIFGQLLNLGSILLSIVVYIKYKQIEFVSQEKVQISRRMNVASLILAWLGAFGIGLVGNFQETSVFIVHVFGALLAFGLLSIYEFLVWRMNNKAGEELKIPNALVNFQLFLSILSLVSIFLSFAFGGLAFYSFKGKNLKKWKPEDGGYALHLVSTISEWVCATSIITFILTYVLEFRKITMSEPEITIADHTTDVLT